MFAAIAKKYGFECEAASATFESANASAFERAHRMPAIEVFQDALAAALAAGDLDTAVAVHRELDCLAQPRPDPHFPAAFGSSAGLWLVH